MRRSVDLRRLLNDWPYDPENNVRVVTGDDGREVLQVRTLLGLEQYELEGRPDGQCPHGTDSLFDYQLGRLEQARSQGREAEFTLKKNECAELFEEGTLFYYRYLHLFQARDWARTVRDTARNLRLFDFVRRYAAREEDRDHLEKWRPYILRMNSIASAMLEVDRGRFDPALQLVESAVRRIENLEELDDETFRYERSRSLQALRELVDEIHRRRPVPELERLEHALREAIQAQAFERAAQLRDRIRELRRDSG